VNTITLGDGNNDTVLPDMIAQRFSFAISSDRARRQMARSNGS
jgi:hypothetical protein